MLPFLLPDSIRDWVYSQHRLLAALLSGLLGIRREAPVVTPQLLAWAGGLNFALVLLLKAVELLLNAMLSYSPTVSFLMMGLLFSLMDDLSREGFRIFLQPPR